MLRISVVDPRGRQDEAPGRGPTFRHPRAWILVLTTAAVAACDEVTVLEETSEFRVELSVSSEILDSTGDTLVGDRVQFDAFVTRDGERVAAGGPTYESSDPGVVRFLDERTGEARLTGTGRATVTAAFTLPDLPERSLETALVVPVDSFAVQIDMTSSLLEAGVEPLAGDTVRFEAEVRRADGRAIAGSGRRFTSSDPSVVAILEPAAGLAVLEGPGSATVTVTFDSVRVPGGVLSSATTVEVADFAIELTLGSLRSGRIEAGDTLATDSVVFDLSVRKGPESDVPVSGLTFSSSDPTRLRFLDPSSGEAILTDTGRVTVTAGFDEPALPRQETGLTLRVTTYRVQMGGPTAPVMGDTAVYDAVVIDTRDGLPVGGTVERSFSSSDTTSLVVVDPERGEVFVRDVGQGEVRAFFSQPRLPHATVQGGLPVTVSQERFYGSPSATAGDFGDPVALQASPVHRFTDTSRVLFSNGVPGWIDSVTSGALHLTVGAGAASGPLILQNLVDDTGASRDDVPTRWSFGSGGTTADGFEPNDTLPLDFSHIMFRPFDELLSLDPTRAAPPDTDFFYLDLRVISVLDFLAGWQADADLDFKVCHASGRPPQDYFRDGQGNPICPRGPGDNTQDRAREEAHNLFLWAGSYVVAFYCADCPDLPVTYRARVR